MLSTLDKKAGLMALIGSLTIFALGCGSGSDGKVKVNGTVTYNGTPLTTGAITFYGPEGKVGGAQIKADGTFVAIDAPLGDVTATVEVIDYGSGMAGGSTKPPKDTPPMPGEGSKVKPVLIPKNYAKKETSGLKYTISDEGQVLEIKLK